MLNYRRNETYWLPLVNVVAMDGAVMDSTQMPFIIVGSLLSPFTPGLPAEGHPLAIARYVLWIFLSQQLADALALPRYAPLVGLVSHTSARQPGQGLSDAGAPGPVYVVEAAFLLLIDLPGSRFRRLGGLASSTPCLAFGNAEACIRLARVGHGSSSSLRKSP